MAEGHITRPWGWLGHPQGPNPFFFFFFFSLWPLGVVRGWFGHRQTEPPQAKATPLAKIGWPATLMWAKGGGP
jgi:hypothetical protein